MAQGERVILTAELRDEATADLNRLKSTVKDTERELKRADREAQRSTSGMGSALHRFVSGGSDLFNRFSKSASNVFSGASDGLRRFTSGFNDSKAAASSFSGVLGTLGGATAKFTGPAVRGIQNLVSGFNDSNAAGSSLTGIMGSLGGAAAKFTGPAVRGIQNLVSGFKDSEAAGSSFTGVLGTIGGAARGIFDRIPGAAKTAFSAAASGAGVITSALGSAASAAGAVASNVGSVVASAASAGAAITSNVLSTLADAASKAGMVAGILGGMVVAEGLRGGFSRAMNIEDAQARMRGMNFEAEKIETLMDNASDAIMGTAFRLDDAATAASQFSAAGINAGEDMERVIGLVGDSAFAAGTGFNDMGDIWAQVAARGRLDGQTLNRLLSAGVGITAELAEHFGVAEDEVQSLVSNGSVSFEDFAEVMEMKVGGAAQEMAETTRGALMNVQAGLHMVGAEVAGPFMELFRGTMNRLQEPMFALAAVAEPVFGVLSERAQAWADTMYSAGEDAAESILGLVEPMEQVAELMREGEGLVAALAEVFGFDPEAGFLGYLGQAIDLFQELSPITGIFSGLAESGGEVFAAIFDTLTEVAPVLGEAFRSIGEALGPVIIMLATSFGELVEVIGPPLLGIVEAVLGAFEQMTPLVGTIIDFVIGALGDVLTAVLPVVEQLIEGAVQVFDALSPILTGVLDTVVSILVQLVEFAAPILESLIGFLVDVFVGLEPIIGDVLDFVVEFFADLLPILGSLFTALGPVIDELLEMGLVLLLALLPLLEPVGDLMLQLAEAGVQVLIAVLPLLPALMELAIAIIEPLVELVAWLVPLIGDNLVEAFELILPLVPDLVDALVFLVEGIGELIDMGLTLGDSLAELWEGISDGAMWLWEEILDPFFSWFGDGFTALSDSVVWAYEELLEPTLSAIGGLFTGIREESLEPVLTWFSETWDSVTGFFSDMWAERIEPTLNKFGAGITVLWEDYVSPAISSVVDRWNWLSDTVGTVWREGIRPIFNAIGDFVHDQLVSRISSGIDLIVSAWERVQEGFARPINWVIDWVWNKGIKTAFDNVASAIGLDKELPEAALISIPGSGGGGSRSNVPGYADGGYMGSGLKLVGEEGPELITTGPGWVATASETQQLLAQRDRNFTKEESQHLAGSHPGEAMLPMGNFVTDSIGAVRDGVSSAASAVTGWVRGGLASMAEKLLSPLQDRAEETLSGFGAAGDMGIGFVDWGVENLLDWIRGQDQVTAEGSITGGKFTGDPGGWNRPSRGVVTSWFGPRWGRLHAGVDLATGRGAPIYAALSGRVHSTGYGARPGNWMMLDHGDRGMTRYLHILDGGFMARPGDTVTGGQQIAREGTTGASTGYHLHFEHHPNGWGGSSTAANINHLFRDQGGPVPLGRSVVDNFSGDYEYMQNAGQFARNMQVVDYAHSLLTASGAGAGGYGHGEGHGGAGTNITFGPGSVVLQYNGNGEMSAEEQEEFEERVREVIEEALEEAERRGY